MKSIQIACLLLVVSPATSTWMKVETFKATGCAANDKVGVKYEWTGVCRSMNDKFTKRVCASSKLTETSYTDSVCTTAETGVTPVETSGACTKHPAIEAWTKGTCDAAPASFAVQTQYATSACTTAVSSSKFATGCLLQHTSSGAGDSTTWAAGSAKSGLEGTPTATTGFKAQVYTTADCTGVSTDQVKGSQCRTEGATKFVTIVAPGAAAASVAKNIRVFSPVVGIFCTATMLTYF